MAKRGSSCRARRVRPTASRHRTWRAYQHTRQLLIAADLDRTTLAGVPPRRFARLLDPKTRDHFNKHRQPGKTSLLVWVSSFAPNTAEFVGNVIKVRGAMSAAPKAARAWKGVAVKVDYLFVHAVQLKGRPETLHRVLVRRTGEVFFVREGFQVRAMPEWTRSVAPSSCDAPDDGTYPCL